MRVILLGSFNYCITWEPLQRPLQQQIKLLQQLTWVNKDLVQLQNHCPILKRQQYSIMWVIQGAQAEKMKRIQGNQEFVCKHYFAVFNSLCRIKTFTAPCHYSFKKCSQHTCIFTLQGKTWWAVLHPSKAQLAIQAWGIEMNIKLNFIVISDQLQQFHIGQGSPKLTIN